MMAAKSFRHTGNLRLESRGFSLVELTFVLLIAGSIIGGVWYAGANAWDNYRVSRAVQQISKTVQNIRDYYMTQQGIAGVNATTPTKDITAASDNASLFPVEMRRNPGGGSGGAIDDPFNNTIAGGSLLVIGEQCPGGISPLLNTCFRIRVQGMYAAVCIRLLEALPASNTDLGIVGVATQNTVPPQSVSATITTAPVPAVTPSVAQGMCNNAGATNEVDWDFKLHN